MLPKRAAFGLLSLSVSSALVIGCGDGEPAQPTSKAIAIGDTGGAQATGGTSASGGSSSNGGYGGLAGASTNLGGSSNAGTSNSGGTSAAGASSGGTSAAGASAGGTSAAGASNTGGSSIAGASTGGTSNTGGSTSTGGTSSTGGSTPLGTTGVGGSTAGSSAVGGTSSSGGTSQITGGTTSTGGSSSTGGALPTGGSPGTGGTTALTCTASFVLPSKATLTNSDDSNSNCQDGIQADVQVATNAPAGTPAVLSVTAGSTTTQVAQTTADGLLATFSNASLGTSGQETLTVSIGGTACEVQKSVNVNCAGAPSCLVADPTISNTHPALNGVLAPTGDRATSGGIYQAAFQVNTDIQDGQPVVLTVDGTQYFATASAGVASFSGVYFPNIANNLPDGNHTVSAQCTSRSNQVGTTGNLTYPVDTTAPDLTPQKGTGTGGATISALANGDHFGAGDDADTNTAGLQIRLCGTTTATDAIDIAAPNPNVNNFCAAYGGNAPQCGSVASSASNSACVIFDCPGNKPFDVTLTLKDRAGNPTTLSRTSLTCASTSPTVSFLDPVSDQAPFSDVSKRILAATNTNATLKDKLGGTPGAQYDVVACTSAQVGSTAILSTGYMGQSLNQNSTTSVVADSNNLCAGGNLIKFTSATLPESLTDSSFNLATATELQISVTDLNLAVGSATSDVWVDSTSPSLTLVSPNGFCGSYFFTNNSTYSVNMTFGSSVPVAVSVQGASGTAQFLGNTVAFSQVTVNGVVLEAGSDTVSALATKPSSNYGTFGPCSVTVGSTPPPTVTWKTPISTSLLTAAGNTNSNAIIDNSASDGWQGTLKVCTNLDPSINPGATVSFSATVNGTSQDLGTASIAADATCASSGGFSASVTPAAVPDGQAVLLTATTSVAGGSAGVASITVPVSSTIPGAPTGLTVDITDRRLTSFTPKWSAPAGTSVTGYKVRVAKTQITSQANFDAARDVVYSGSGTCPVGGCSVLVDGCYIENDYYFAVAAVDYVGNQGAFVATSAATAAHFIQSSLTPATSNQRFGNIFDGTGDVNNDGFSDLIVNYNSGIEVDIFFGGVSGYSSNPSVRIQGSVNQFGIMVAAIGDINADGYEDLAVGSAVDGDGKVYVYFGRSTAQWLSKPTRTASDADITITVDATADSQFTLSRLGWGLARLGDYNNDGVDDFAVSAYRYKSFTGLVAIVLGNAQSKGGLPSSIVLPTAFGNGVLRIDGEATNTRFGYTLTGLGRFYGSTSTPALLVGEPFANTNAGKLFAFQGVPGSTFNTTAASNVYNGSAGETLSVTGINCLGNIGPGGQPALGLTIPDLAPSRVDLMSGTVAAGPFAVRTSITSTESSASTYGRMLVGGGISGRASTFSFIGPKGGRADIAVTTRANSNPRLYIVDGDKISLPSSLTIEPPTADVVVPLNGTFVDFSRQVTAIPDVDGDGYGDIAVGDTDYTASPTTGRVLVLR